MTHTYFPHWDIWECVGERNTNILEKFSGGCVLMALECGVRWDWWNGLSVQGHHGNLEWQGWVTRCYCQRQGGCRYNSGQKSQGDSEDLVTPMLSSLLVVKSSLKYSLWGYGNVLDVWADTWFHSPPQILWWPVTEFLDPNPFTSPEPLAAEGELGPFGVSHCNCSKSVLKNLPLSSPLWELRHLPEWLYVVEREALSSSKYY